MDPDEVDAEPQPSPSGQSFPVVELDLFGGLTEEEFDAAQEELRRGCGWG